MLSDIKTREDIQKIVTQYYDRLLNSARLSPNLIKKIPAWRKYLFAFTNFWDDILLTKREGIQITIPQEISYEMSYEIKQRHSYWLLLNFWIATVDDNFNGKVALEAKSRARKIYSTLFNKISKKNSFEKKLLPH